jgi:hypothetical protein
VVVLYSWPVVYFLGKVQGQKSPRTHHGQSDWHARSQLKPDGGRAYAPHPTMAFCLTVWLKALMLSILVDLMRGPSGCFCCISRCSLGSCCELSADPAVAPSLAPQGAFNVNTQPH